MRSVHKYPLNPGLNVVSMPKGSKLLTVGLQKDSEGNSAIVLWALVDLITSQQEQRTIAVVNTGRNVDSDCCVNYVGSLAVPVKEINEFPNGVVWHVFSDS